jgi:hypothetical protein
MVELTGIPIKKPWGDYSGSVTVQGKGKSDEQGANKWDKPGIGFRIHIQGNFEDNTQSLIAIGIPIRRELI